jgi:hypothetical protein
MNIECSKCMGLNQIQHHCGNCGQRLLVDGVKIKTEQTIENQSKMTTSINDSQKLKRWSIGFLYFLLIWIVGGTVLAIVFAYLGLGGESEKFIVAICFVIGIIVMFKVGNIKKENKKIDIKDKKHGFFDI